MSGQPARKAIVIGSGPAGHPVTLRHAPLGALIQGE